MDFEFNESFNSNHKKFRYLFTASVGKNFKFCAFKFLKVKIEGF